MVVHFLRDTHVTIHIILPTRGEQRQLFERVRRDTVRDETYWCHPEVSDILILRIHPEKGKMGQEASVPVPEGQEDYSMTNGKGPRAAKAIGNMIRRGNEGVEYNDRETARAAAAGGHFAMSADADREQYQYPSSQMTPEQQQAYIMQQQYDQNVMQQQQQQAYMKPGMTQQSYMQQQAHSNSNGIPAPPPAESPPHDAAVTVMMAEPSRGGRAGKLPGTRLINSMKNLAISAKGVAGAVAHGADHDGSVRSPAADSVTDWQRQWEDDDESDEEDEDNVKMPARGLHAPLQPGMDEGYSQAAAGLPNVDPRLAPASPERESATMSTRSPKDGIIRTPPSRQFDRQESDSVEWDTGKQVMPRKEKPSIEMFLPMLRVLGKGSFGKVRLSFVFMLSFRVCIVMQ